MRRQSMADHSARRSSHGAITSAHRWGGAGPKAGAPPHLHSFPPSSLHHSANPHCRPSLRNNVSSEGGAAANLTYYAQMTPAPSTATVSSVEIRENPLHRAFADPRAREASNRGLRRMAGNCTTPVHLTYPGAIPDGQGGTWSAGAKYVDQEISVRCRNCPSCLRSRRYQWALRAQWEIMVHPSTWFFTGTHRDQGHDYVAAKEEVQRFLKRLRKRASQRNESIRYLMLPELHKSGAIHWHGLLHHGGSVTYRMVANSWTAGYSYPSLVRNKEATAHYVTKYATKDLLGAGTDDTGRSRRPRILASRSPTYGDPVIIRDADVVQALAKQNQEETSTTWIKNLRQAIRELDRSKEGARSAHRMILEANSGSCSASTTRQE